MALPLAQLTDFVLPAAPERGGSESPSARLARMIDRDYRLIWRLLRRLGTPADAIEDATQQVFLIAAERLDDIRETSERAFVFGTALRLSQSLRRKRARETADADADQRPSLVPGADEQLDQKRARELLDRVLDRLPFDLRAVFVLYEIEGMRSPEIASLLGLPLGTVASRLRRAREAFHALVNAQQTTRAAGREGKDE